MYYVFIFLALPAGARVAPAPAAYGSGATGNPACFTSVITASATGKAITVVVDLGAFVSAFPGIIRINLLR